MPARLARAFRALLAPPPLPGNVCILCRGDCVNPVAWDEAGEDRWLVAVRCGACGQEYARELSQDEAASFLSALDRGYFAIETAADRLEHELMTDWVETFAAALERDLIDAGDFREAGPSNPRSAFP